MAKAAIIIPAYNVEGYIHRALESSVNQTQLDIEIIVIDDGSTDKTALIIEKYVERDSRILFRKQKNSGVSSARNKALSLATAENVLFLDSDDWLEENAVEELLELKKNNVSKLICAECYYVNQNTDGSIERAYQGDHSPQITLDRNEALHYTGKHSRYKLLSSCYKLFDNKVIKENRIRFEETIHYGEDGLFTFHYLCHVNGLCYCSIPLWDILDRPGSATKASYSSKWLGGITAVDIMLQQKDIDAKTVESLLALKAIRAMVAEMLAIRSKQAPLNEIKYARSVLRENGLYFIKETKQLKLSMQIIALTRFPIWVLRIILRK